MTITQARIDSIGYQLLNHGIGVVSENAAKKIAEMVPEKPRLVDGKALVDAVERLAKSGEIEIVKVGGSIALE